MGLPKIIVCKKNDIVFSHLKKVAVPKEDKLPKDMPAVEKENEGSHSWTE